ncbi:MAG: response regulator [Deltaproteobacteria bacterium]
MVLVVEDDADTRDNLAALLRSDGFTVTTADNGREALDWLRASDTLPDLIVLDLMMPVMDGWQFRMEQVQDPSLALIPVLVLSSEPDIRGEATALRVEVCVSKPIDAKALLEEVRHMTPRH